MYRLHSISVIVSLAALVFCTDAVTREEIPQCIEQLVARLRGFELDPAMYLVLDRGFPDDGTEHDLDKDIDIKELSEAVCEDHNRRLYATMKDLNCHREFLESPEFADEYSDAVQRLADRHSRFCILGAGICDAHKNELRTKHRIESGESSQKRNPDTKHRRRMKKKGRKGE